jgi:hypothetical protein
MAERSAMPIHGWLEVLAGLEHERRTCRAKAEIFSRLRNVVKAAGFIAQADETAEELAEARATAIAGGIPAEAISHEVVEAWGIANLDGGPHRIWEWDAEHDLPASLA